MLYISMADNSNKQLLVVLDKYQDRVSELVVVTTATKNRKSLESSSEASTMDMKTFISSSFSSKMFVNIFDAGSEEWLWKTNPKVTHIHERCVELWGPKEEPKEEEPVEPEVEEEEPVEPEVEEEELDESEEKSAEVEESEESEEESEPKVDLFAAAREAAANRKAKDSSTTSSKPSTKKANSSKPSKKVKPLKKATELEEDLDEDEELEDEETTEKSGFLIWVLSCIVIAIAAISIYLTFKPGKELETLGLTAQYTEATNRLNQEVEPAWYRWESWDRSVAAEATLTWGPYFRALYVTGEGANPTPNSIQLYAVYLTLKVLVQQGHEPGEALRIIREEGSKSVVSALNKGNISREDIAFIREYMMK